MKGGVYLFGFAVVPEIPIDLFERVNIDDTSPVFLKIVSTESFLMIIINVDLFTGAYNMVYLVRIEALHGVDDSSMVLLTVCVAVVVIESVCPWLSRVNNVYVVGAAVFCITRLPFFGSNTNVASASAKTVVNLLLLLYAATVWVAAVTGSHALLLPSTTMLDLYPNIIATTKTNNNIRNKINGVSFILLMIYFRYILYIENIQTLSLKLLRLSSSEFARKPSTSAYRFVKNSKSKIDM